MSKRPVVCQLWLESERGWGHRPDGASLHLTAEDAKLYAKDYWDSMPAAVPDEYSREDGSTFIIDVDDDLYAKIKSSKNGIRMWQHEYREMIKK